MLPAAVTALRKAARGLLYLSEKDAPFKTVTLGPVDRLTKARVLELTGHDGKSPIEETPLEEFFVHLVSEKKWHGADEKAMVKKFRNLLQVLEETLDKVRVFKVGDVKIDYYILGKTEDGQWTGLKTQALET